MISKSKLEEIIKFVLLAGVATLFIWKWSLRETLIPKPSQFFFGLALLLGIVYFIFFDRFKSLKNIPLLVWVGIAIIVLSMTIATLYGYFKYDLGWTLKGIFYALHLLIGIALFILFFIFLEKDEVFYKRLCYAFFFPPLLFIPFLFFPNAAQRLRLLDQVRFLGISDTPNTVGLYLFIALTFSLIFLLRYTMAPGQKDKIKNILLYLFSGAGLESLLIWTWSRSYFGAMWFSITLSIVGMGIIYKKKAATIALYLLAAFAIGLFVFFSSPPWLHRETLMRGYSQLKGYITYAPLAKDISQKMVDITLNQKTEMPNIKMYTDVGQYKDTIGGRALPIIQPSEIVASSSVESRLFSTAYYIFLFQKDIYSFIFGLGFNFEQRFNFFISIGDSIKTIGAESVESSLDVFLFGGILLLIGILWMIALVLKNMRNHIRSSAGEHTAYYFGAMVVWIGFIAAGTFPGIANRLFGFPFWILLAMALTKIDKNKKETEEYES